MKDTKTIEKFRFKSLFTGMLPFFIAAHFGHHLVTALPMPLMPMIRSEFGLDYTQSGFVLSAFSIAYGIGQLPSGWLADHIGRRIMITVGILGVAVCGLLIGLSSTYSMMIALMALMGLMGGGYHPSASPAVASTVRPENRGSALGFHLIGGSLSYFLAPLAAVGIATALGWRGPFMILSIAAIAFGATFYILLGRVPGLNKAMQKTGASEQFEIVEKPGRIRRLIIFIVLTSFTGALLFSMESFIPMFLVDRFNVSKEAGGAFIAIFASSGLWASTLGGYLADRFGRVRMILILCFSIGVLIYLINLAPFGIAMGALLVVLGMFAYMRMPISESYIIMNTSEKRRSTILGIYFFTAMEGSGVLMPVLGKIIDTMGFNVCYTIVAVCVLVISFICFFLLRGSKD
jgi:MFS family permease